MSLRYTCQWHLKDGTVLKFPEYLSKEKIEFHLGVVKTMMELGYRVDAIKYLRNFVHCRWSMVDTELMTEEVRAEAAGRLTDILRNVTR